MAKTLTLTVYVLAILSLLSCLEARSLAGPQRRRQLSSSIHALREGAQRTLSQSDFACGDYVDGCNDDDVCIENVCYPPPQCTEYAAVSYETKDGCSAEYTCEYGICESSSDSGESYEENENYEEPVEPDSPSQDSVVDPSLTYTPVVSEPVAEPVYEPVYVPVYEPVIEPVVEPVAASTSTPLPVVPVAVPSSPPPVVISAMAPPRVFIPSNSTFNSTGNSKPAVAPAAAVSDDSGGSSLSTGAIVGIAVGGAALLAAIAAGGFFWHRRSQNREPEVAEGLESTLGPDMTMGGSSTLFSTSEPSSPMVAIEEGSEGPRVVATANADGATAMV